MQEARLLVDASGYIRYTTRLIDEPAVGHGDCSSHETVPFLPSESYLWVPTILNAMGGSDWAQQLVPALPSHAELQADGAPDNDWSLDDLVAAAREAIWGDCATVHLRKEDITTRQGGFVYFKLAFQERLSKCLQNHPAYKNTQAWMLARFNRATKEVLYSIHN